MKPKNLAEKLEDRKAFSPVILMAGFLLAVALRVAVGGARVASSPEAGLIFATVLITVCGAYGLATKVTLKSVLIGILGAAILLVVPFVEKIIGPSNATPSGDYLLWSIIITCVALAEEAFLRGTFFDAVTKWQGEKTAIVVSAVLFALLHIPLYGWHVIPLDFAVGLWLGVLRVESGSWIAPGIAHTLADLFRWWLI